MQLVKEYQTNGFSDSYREQEFREMKSMMAKAVKSPVFMSPQDAQRLCDDILSGEADKVKSAMRHLAKSAVVADAIYHGILPEKMAESMKTVTGGPLPVAPTVTQVFVSYGNENEVDREWMRIFNTVPLTDSLLASINELQNLIEWHDLAADTSDIPESDIVDGIWSLFRPKWKGSAVRLSREKLKKDPFGYLTFIVQGMRYKLEVKRTQDAYTTIQGAIVAADAAGYVTNFTTDLRQTLNSAAVTIRERNGGRGFAVSRQTPLHLLAHELYLGNIEANFFMTNNVIFGTVQAQYTFDRSYTLNLATDLGLGYSAALLSIPGQYNQYGLFNGYTTESEEKIANNAVCFYGRTAYNFTYDVDQFQIVKLA